VNWKCLFIPIDKIEIIQEGVKAFGNYGQDVHWYEGKGIGGSSLASLGFVRGVY